MKKQSKKQSLIETHPHIAKQWHPVKNGDLYASKLIANTNRNVWWLCPVSDDHVWQNTVAYRAKANSKCPFCINYRLSKTNSLLTLHPILAKRWHYKKNFPLTPKDVVGSRSKRLYWWRCDVDHEWKASIISHIRKDGSYRGCPKCHKAPLSVTHLGLLKEWHPTKNKGLFSDKVRAGSNQYIWWKCSKGPDHEWRQKAVERSRAGSGCPFCDGKRVSVTNSLSSKHPFLANEWHPIKNGNLLPEGVFGGGKAKFWWKCSKGSDHEWQANIQKRASGHGCPICRGLKIVLSNSLFSTYPNIVKEWHPTKNSITPKGIFAGSGKKVWWQCLKDDSHEWMAPVKNRAYRGSGCPICLGSQVHISNCLATLKPNLAKEWHPSKNGKLTPFDVVVGSGKRVWWACAKDVEHIWKAAVCARATGTGCPFCNSGWTVEKIRRFILSLLPYLNTLSPVELYAIFQQNGLLNSTGKGSSFIKNFLSGKLPKDDLIEAVGDPQKFTELIELQKDQLINNEDEIGILSENEVKLDESDLPIVQTKDILESIDSKIVASADAETVDFLIKSAVAKIWRHTFRNEKEAQLQLEQYQGEGEYPREVKKLFLDGYHSAKNLKIPEGYNENPPGLLPRKEELGLMQRYVASQIKTRKRFGNWSGTGAGKTLSAILASRVIDSKLTVICCPNNVIGTWRSQIKGSYSDSVIYTKESILRITTDDAKNKYLILNYEFFQQSTSESKLKKLIEKCAIDFIVIDEIHQSKQRVQQKISKRKILVASFLSEASDKNLNLSILGMSATPVINNLFEGKTLLELITGIYHDELNTLATPSNCIALYKKFVSHGIRYLPDYKMQFNLKKELIDCSDQFDEIKEHKSWVELEGILTRAKLPFILDQLRPKTIVYTHYREGIEIALQEAIVQKGWSASLFNGSTKDGLDKFINGDVDILIATSCIGTGVDGLQKVCNRLIINCLPWTHAEYKQLIGRIYRQGQIKDNVDIIVPLTFAEINGERWSWCESRWKRIEFKKSIADAAVDGVIPEGHLRSAALAHKDSMKWFDRLANSGIHEVERSKIALELSADFQQPPLRRIGDLSRMNQEINNDSSQDTHKRFLKSPEEWHDYHASFRATRESWPVIPNHEALKWCKTRPDLVIGDFGCGEALLAQELKNKIYSFDHVAINNSVIACDMSQVPLENESIGAAIFSLSLMGTNFVDYLKEAKRCLKLDGWLWLAEPTSRIKDIEQFKELLRKLGFYMIDVESKDRFTFIKALKSEREMNEIGLDRQEKVLA